MKKLYILLITIFTINIITVKSQTNVICEQGNWKIHYQIGAPPTESYTYCKTGGDTIINGVKYIKIFRKNIASAPIITLNGPLFYIAAFRNDTMNRAFIYPANDSIEHLWYDFNLNIGDSLPTNPRWYSYDINGSSFPNNVTVSQIDSVQWCYSSHYHKRFKFSISGYVFPDLVQDMGFTGDLINYNFPCFECYISVDNWSPDSLLSSCFPQIVGIKEIDKSNSISIYPNPTSSILTIETNSNTQQKLEIVNLLGQTMYTYYIYSKATVDVSAFAKGIYIMKLNTDKGIIVKKFIKE